MTDIAAGWASFLSTEAGASAALTGLLFVAASINLRRVLEFPNLPARIVEGMLTLLSPLAVATFALAPGQPGQAIGWEIAGTGACVWLMKSVALIRSRRSMANIRIPALRIAANQLPAIPFVVCGILLIAGNPGGMYWLIPGTLLSYAGGFVDIWVLLIEINR